MLGYNAWNTSKNDNAGGGSETLVDEDTLNQVIMVGLVAFVGLTTLILAVAFIINRRKTAAATKAYGGVAPGASTNASLEALEGRGGISADGGIIADASWDDDVAQLDFSENDGFDDMAIKNESDPDEADSMTYAEESMEAIAGVSSEPAPEPEPAQETTAMPAEAPPLPEGGLPEGWTMDQWRWYGHEWLAKYGKN